MKFVFLDFDGVLHANHGKDVALWTFLPRVESILRDFPETRVVISSSWGDRRSIEELREFFSPDIRPRIVDKVQTIPRRMAPMGERGDACRRFCRRHKLRAGDWLAIDDMGNLFHGTDPLIHCMNGFRDDADLLLRMALANEIPAWRFAFEIVVHLLNAHFDWDARRTREYVITHRAETVSSETIAQLLFARRRRAVNRQLHWMDAAAPREPLSHDEWEARFGYVPALMWQIDRKRSKT